MTCVRRLRRVRLELCTLIVLAELFLGCAPAGIARGAEQVGGAGGAVLVGHAGETAGVPSAGLAGRSGFAGTAGQLGNAGRAGDPDASHAPAGAPAQAAAGHASDSGVAGADAANGGAGGAAGATSAHSGCAGTAFALCDDFESGTLNAQLWKAVQTKGTVTLDATRGARGSHSSVHVHIDAGSDTMVGLTETSTFPALKAGLSARAFIYIPSANMASLFTGDRHTRLIYAQGTSPDGEYALGIWNGGLIQNHYSKSDDSVDTKMLPPFDSWFCLEYELDSAGGNVKAYLDDVEISALRHSGWPAANIDTLMFGADRYGNFPVAEDLWFDDVAVDHAHIGCSR